MKQLKRLGITVLLCSGLIFPVLAQESPQPEITPVPQFDAQGYVRVGHFMPDGMAIDSYIDGELHAENIDYTMLSEWLVVPTGTHTLTIAGTGNTPDENIFQTEVEVVSDQWLTVGLMGTPDNISVSLIPQEMYVTLPSTAQITFANGLNSGETLNFTRDDVVFVASVPVVSGATMVQNSIPVDTNTYTYNIHASDGQPITPGVEVDTVDATSYLAIAVGTLDNPQLIVDETPNWEIRLLNGELEAPATLLEVAQSEPMLAPFLHAMETAGLQDILTQSDPVTIFVPADYVMDDLDLTREDLAEVLRYHIVDGNYAAGDLFLGSPTLNTIDGDVLSLTETEHGFINGVQIIDVNMMGTNGTIHILGGMLNPAE